MCINRLKLLEKKKTEQAMKARKEIADYIKADRIERARIRVEHIIREDYLVEAMEVLETFCDLLLARFGMLQTMSFCDAALIEPVSTLIWATPRLQADVEEFKVISKQLTAKFGQKFAELAVTNQSENVNEKVIHRLGLQTPPRRLVESYMKEIAKNYRVEYDVDPAAFLEDDVPEPINEKDFLPRPDDNPSPPGGYGGPPPGGNGMPGGPAPYNPQAYPPATSLPPGYSQGPQLPYPQQPTGPVTMPPGGGGGMNFPSVPSGPPAGGSGQQGGDLDFDDLTKRFERLKGKK